MIFLLFLYFLEWNIVVGIYKMFIIWSNYKNIIELIVWGYGNLEGLVIRVVVFFFLNVILNIRRKRFLLDFYFFVFKV